MKTRLILTDTYDDYFYPSITLSDSVKWKIIEAGRDLSENNPYFIVEEQSETNFPLVRGVYFTPKGNMK